MEDHRRALHPVWPNDEIEPIFMLVSALESVERAVSNLSKDELAAFRGWFFNFEASRWDEEFENDVAAGRLDALADEAIRDLREGRCRDL